MSASDAAFGQHEYDARLAAARRSMAARGIDLLIVTDPANMHWLTGYDGWSFYVHQCVVVPLDDDALWFGRQMDVNGARRTAFLPEEALIGYPDQYVQTPAAHPMDYLSARLRERGWTRLRIGVEKDSYYFTAAAMEALVGQLPDATFVDATALVNWERAVKSPAELQCMRSAARIVEEMHARIYEIVEPGVAKNLLVAEILRTGVRGVEGLGGDYPAIVPILPSGADASAPHLTWDDQPIEADTGTFFEVAGCYRRYHCPLSRTVYLGRPPRKFLDAEAALVEGLERGIEAARPGNRCADIANAFHDVVRRAGIEKKSRCGYSIGLGYPPDWGEHTMSLRPEDDTLLQPGMTFHFMPGLWFDDWGIEITESILVTEQGAEPLANVPRQLFVKE